MKLPYPARTKSLYIARPLELRIEALAKSEKRHWNSTAILLLEEALAAREPATTPAGRPTRRKAGRIT